jgi:hypothetical protein
LNFSDPEEEGKGEGSNRPARNTSASAKGPALTNTTAAPPAPATFGEDTTAEPFVTKLRDSITVCVLWAQVLLVTLCMAYTETTDVPTLVLGIVSVVSLIMLECRELYYDVAGWWPSLAVAGVAVMLLAYMHVFLRKVDLMEHVAEKYAAVDQRLELGKLQRLESAETEQSGRASLLLRLGPLQNLVEDLRQPESFVTLESLLLSSAELGNQFEQRVLLPLFQALPLDWTLSMAAPTFNLKTAKRSREKTRLEYNKDFLQLKDTLRGSIICRTMAEIGIVWGALKQLEANGILQVLQVKNRYRGPPMPGGYRDININVLFEGIICEVQLHTEGHYVLKRELHPSYKLCRSVGLVGDIEGFDSNGTIANNETPPRHKPWSVTNVGILFLRCCFAVLLAVTAGYYFSLKALEWAGEEKGWILRWKGASLAIPCWRMASMFVLDAWDANRAGSAFALLALALLVCIWLLLTPLQFWINVDVTLYALGALLPVVAVLLWRKFLPRDPAKSKLPRIALLYSLYFGVDGKYFAWKSAIRQCFIVGFQASAKLSVMGTIVSGPGSKAMYWLIFALLVGNIVLPPLLLSSPVPWVRREGAMSFDVFCDLFYTVGVSLWYLMFSFDLDAVVPVDIVGYLSVVTPCLRVRYVVRTIEAASWSAAGNANPSRLPHKAAVGIGLLSLAGFALALGAQPNVYPWNTDACRPCKCSSSSGGLVMERCSFEGRSLVLSNRGITGIMAGAFNGAPKLGKLKLAYNDFRMLPPLAFDGAPLLEFIAMDYNKISFLNAGVFHSSAMLKRLDLAHNLLSSLEDFSGALDELPSLETLLLSGNDVSCEEIQMGNETWLCYD